MLEREKNHHVLSFKRKLLQSQIKSKVKHAQAWHILCSQVSSPCLIPQEYQKRYSAILIGFLRL
jgi:hypothetical protein